MTLGISQKLKPKLDSRRIPPKVNKQNQKDLMSSEHPLLGLDMYTLLSSLPSVSVMLSPLSVGLKHDAEF
jgi:hypothetical protein